MPPSGQSAAEGWGAFQTYQRATACAGSCHNPTCASTALPPRAFPRRVCPTSRLFRTEFARWWCSRTCATAAAYCARLSLWRYRPARGRRPRVDVHPRVTGPGPPRTTWSPASPACREVDPVRLAGRPARARGAASRQADVVGARPRPGSTEPTTPTTAWTVGASSLLLTSPECTGCPPYPVANHIDVGQVWTGVLAGSRRWGAGSQPPLFGWLRCTRDARWSRAPSRQSHYGHGAQAAGLNR